MSRGCSLSRTPPVAVRRGATRTCRIRERRLGLGAHHVDGHVDVALDRLGTATARCDEQRAGASAGSPLIRRYDGIATVDPATHLEQRWLFVPDGAPTVRRQVCVGARLFVADVVPDLRGHAHTPALSAPTHERPVRPARRSCPRHATVARSRRRALTFSGTCATSEMARPTMPARPTRPIR